MRRLAVVAAVAAGQLALVGVAVAPQLSARALGDSYVLRVAPLDPIDPFRGAYASLDYPDLRNNEARGAERGLGSMEDGQPHGAVYITLARADDVWVADEFLRDRPGEGPYLACDDHTWQIRCGIESWFLPQDEALALERELADGAYAEVRIDSRGNAALVDVRESP